MYITAISRIILLFVVLEATVSCGNDHERQHHGNGHGHDQHQHQHQHVDSSHQYNSHHNDRENHYEPDRRVYSNDNYRHQRPKTTIDRLYEIYDRSLAPSNYGSRPLNGYQAAYEQQRPVFNDPLYYKPHQNAKGNIHNKQHQNTQYSPELFKTTRNTIKNHVKHELFRNIPIANGRTLTQTADNLANNLVKKVLQ